MAHAEIAVVTKPCTVCYAQSATLKYPANAAVPTAHDVEISNDDYGKHARMVRCTSCGLIYVDDSLLTKEHMQDCYASMSDPVYQEEVARREKVGARILSRIRQYGKKSSGALLDVGAATGNFLDAAKKDGWLVAGTELSAWAREKARSLYGIELGTSFADLGDARFDVVTMLDVIEHVDNPREFLVQAHARLAPAGVLGIVTPNIGSVAARLFGERWWHVRTAHIFYFDKKTISRLLVETGFRVVAVRQYVWYFSVPYIFERLGSLSVLRFSKPLFMWLAKQPVFKSLTIPVCLGDSMEIYAVKA